MFPVNLPSGAQRNTDVGLVWREVLKDGVGVTDFEVPMQGTIRVSAAADVEVTIDGVVVMTLRSGEVERLNVGAGAAGDSKSTVRVQITSGSGSARVQVAQEKDPGRRTR